MTRPAIVFTLALVAACASPTVPTRCESANDCDGGGACAQATCTNGTCGVTFTAAGTPIGQQTAGNCQIIACDGDGGVTTQSDDSNVPALTNPCAVGACVNGKPTTLAIAVGAVPDGGLCDDGGESFCDGAGHCAACIEDSDCSGGGMCQSAVCDAGACIVEDSPLGTRLPDTTPGNCHTPACDGDGGTIMIAANDPPANSNPCVTVSCDGGGVVSVAERAGASCANDGLCDGRRNCVQCLNDTDCPASTSACAPSTCTTSNVCVPALSPVDAPCPSGVCNGNGSCVQCVTAADCPASGSSCSAAACTDNACGTVPAPNGDACSGGVCDGNGNCVTVPASIVITATSPLEIGRSGIIDLAGLGQFPFSAQALDANGNAISGPGAPAFVVSASGALAVQTTSPAQTSPTRFFVAPPSTLSSGTATVQVIADYSSQAFNPCATAGAVCTASVTVDMVETIVVANEAGSLAFFTTGASAPFLSYSSGTASPAGLAVDASGDIAFVNTAGTSAVVLAGGSLTPTTLTGFLQPTATAFDTRGNLFVADSGANVVLEFAAGTTTPSRTISAGIGNPIAVACDTNGRVYVVNRDPAQVTEYDAEQDVPVVTISGLTTPQGLALGPGMLPELYVADSGAGAVFGYAYGTNTPIGEINGPGTIAPNGVVVNSAGNLDVSGSLPSPGSVAQYAAPVTSVVSGATSAITQGIADPVALAFDAEGDLIVANLQGGVTIYASGATTPTAPGIESGVSDPQGIVVIP